jgi:hypothetical protein
MLRPFQPPVLSYKLSHLPFQFTHQNRQLFPAQFPDRRLFGQSLLLDDRHQQTTISIPFCLDALSRSLKRPRAR